MTTTLDLGSDFRSQDYPVLCSVAVRESWSDNWVDVPYLWVDRITWSAAPRISTAQMSWRYGYGKQNDRTYFENIARQDYNRWYVKITVNASSVLTPGTLLPQTWCGVVDQTRDGIGGVVEVATGEQAFMAYGLELLLHKYPIMTATVKGTTERRSHSGLVFNGSGIPNKYATLGSGGFPVFADATSTAELWSTRDIVDNVVGEHMPIDGDGWRKKRFSQVDDIGPNVQVPFSLDTTGRLVLPTFDTPAIPTHGKTPAQILTMVIARQRLLGWRVEYNDILDEATIVPFSFTDEDIYLAGNYKIPKNDQTYHLDVRDSADGPVVVRFDTTGTYDQVIVEGAHRRSVFSIADADSNLVAGWGSTEEADYESGASTDAGYPAATEKDERRDRNTEARAAESLADVYSRFQLPSNWDYKAGDGIGGSQNPAFLKNVDDGSDDFGLQYTPYYPNVAIESTLPLLANIDYSTGSSTPLGTGPNVELSPIVVIEKPDAAGHYVAIDKAGMQSDQPTTDTDDNKRWSARVHVNTRFREPAFRLNVTGQPQHVIATADFTPLTEDKDLGSWDWRDMIATVSIEDERRTFGEWPRSKALPIGVDAIRVMRIQAGDSYRQDFMPDNTILGVNPVTGALIRSPSPQWVNDDREALENLARVAFQWYGQERRVFEMATRRVFNELTPGDLIVSVSRTAAENQDVGTVVTEIAMSFPRSTTAEAAPASMMVKTAYAELDPLRV